MVIVKYSKDNCPGCDELKIFCDLSGLVFDEEVDVMRDMSVIERKQKAIMSVPTVILYKDGVEIGRVIGPDKDKITDLFALKYGMQ